MKYASTLLLLLSLIAFSSMAMASSKMWEDACKVQIVQKNLILKEYLSEVKGSFPADYYNPIEHKKNEGDLLLSLHTETYRAMKMCKDYLKPEEIKDLMVEAAMYEFFLMKIERQLQ
jgi:hypothetical protein